MKKQTLGRNPLPKEEKKEPVILYVKSGKLKKHGKEIIKDAAYNAIDKIK